MEENKQVGFALGETATNIIAYITWIGLLVALIFGDRRKCRFHLNQAAVLALFTLLVGVVGGILSAVFSIVMTFVFDYSGVFTVLPTAIFAAASIGMLILWFMGLVSAILGNEKPVPVLGKIQLLR